MPRLFMNAIWEWKLWRIRRQNPQELRVLQDQLERARRRHEPTAHIIKRMKQVRNEGLRR